MNLQSIDAATRKEWDDLLGNTFLAGSDNEMIGGGAIRDRLLGVPPADIDLFYSGDVKIEWLAKRVGLKSYEYRPLDNHTQYDVKVLSIIDAVTAKGEPLNLLRCGSVERRFHEFAADISKVFYQQGRVIMTDAFLNAVETKTVNFDLGVSGNYVTKIAKKFQPLGFQFRVAGSLLDVSSVEQPEFDFA